MKSVCAFYFCRDCVVIDRFQCVILEEWVCGSGYYFVRGTLSEAVVVNRVPCAVL
jgi:hypothetical protein